MDFDLFYGIDPYEVVFYLYCDENAIDYSSHSNDEEKASDSGEPEYGLSYSSDGSGEDNEQAQDIYRDTSDEEEDAPERDTSCHYSIKEFLLKVKVGKFDHELSLKSSSYDVPNPEDTTPVVHDPNFITEAYSQSKAHKPEKYKDNGYSLQ